ncbi:MAG: PqqD family protein [Candidatus Omnitrophota bacterium]
MESKVNLNSIYKPAEENVVAREIQEEFILIPIISGIGDMEDEIFSLNESGKAVWQKLDGTKSLKDVVKELSQQFAGKTQEIEKDVLGIAQELLKRKMLVEVKKD